MIAAYLNHNHFVMDLIKELPLVQKSLPSIKINRLGFVNVDKVIINLFVMGLINSLNFDLHKNQMHINYIYYSFYSLISFEYIEF